MATDLLTASDYYRLAKSLPVRLRKFDGEPRRVTEQRRKEKNATAISHANALT